jgi:tetratricopeptide (TPR) repeat protein
MNQVNLMNPSDRAFKDVFQRPVTVRRIYFYQSLAMGSLLGWAVLLGAVFCTQPVWAGAPLPSVVDDQTAYGLAVAGRFQEAVSVYDRLIQLDKAHQTHFDSNLKVVYLNWGHAEIEAGRFDSARRVYATAQSRFSDGSYQQKIKQALASVDFLEAEALRRMVIIGRVKSFGERKELKKKERVPK